MNSVTWLTWKLLEAADGAVPVPFLRTVQQPLLCVQQDHAVLQSLQQLSHQLAASRHVLDKDAMHRLPAPVPSAVHVVEAIPVCVLLLHAAF